MYYVYRAEEQNYYNEIFVLASSQKDALDALKENNFEVETDFDGLPTCELFNPQDVIGSDEVLVSKSIKNSVTSVMYEGLAKASGLEYLVRG